MEEEKENKRGRPGKLTPEMKELIIKYILSGNYIEVAALAAGISKVTLYSWIKRGRMAREQGRRNIYRDFLNAIEQAFAKSEAHDVYNIAQAAETQWQASAWRLERKFPERWGKRIKIAGDQDAPLILKTWADVVKNLSEREKRKAESDNGGPIENCSE